MHINFSKIVHFTRLIKAGGRLREFNFRKVTVDGEEIFNADTVDDRGNRILFRMQKKDGKWILSPLQILPQWITENEDKFNSEIEIGIEEN
ncbi:hypothetical protein ACFS6H_19260 [Terrimonas rubra]|jgi:hypothetical protein|uniref:Uncharacterized protein n=1 Tax=Terrimonas rubra TaxID=1035890 RepID=A0ABW6AAR7_9BACT